jgi:hypothetical protein
MCDLIFMVYWRVQTKCGEDTQQCKFSHCFPECEDSVFSEVFVAYQTTRIPRSEFWYVPASVNCDFERYLQVWTVSKFNVQDVYFMWTVSSILFVVRRICYEPLRTKFSLSNSVPILIRSDKMQQYAGIYLLQNYSTCFGCPSHPSSGVHKTVTAASGTGHSIWATTFPQRGLIRLRYYDLYQRLRLQFYLLLMMGATDTRNM